MVNKPKESSNEAVRHVGKLRKSLTKRHVIRKVKQKKKKQMKPGITVGREVTSNTTGTQEMQVAGLCKSSTFNQVMQQPERYPIKQHPDR